MGVSCTVAKIKGDNCKILPPRIFNNPAEVVLNIQRWENFANYYRPNGRQCRPQADIDFLAFCVLEETNHRDDRG